MPVISDTELQRRRAEIIEGARRCFAEYGYEGATVRRLEQATGKSRGAIFHHFGDKEHLFLAIARADAARQADIVAESGLIEVMRDILRDPKSHDWLATRLEITTMLRTDPSFRARWLHHQEVLDSAVRERLEQNAERDRLRTDVSIGVLHTFLETVMDGFITRLASGHDLEGMEQVLDIAEDAIRKH
ncbi:TetR family transcriptional regulator [Corynebacterium yudongzhengii]|uniref:TetR/AcrR family transcriptional regulator n=1 Tax=Corynebacterium yudongzhengii TaxID=2080740 RepID=A0A2U1T8F9_9CORY|nr:TetR/AcrR family transcriptional regulator [Corynebacterium yudongzhengii]AWB81877.1 TetR family transcriptional regulator [Corynebacterium yudongzhengii]PWC02269.1 TetR/AcrR family transcriptional regulator [Corynebacterium yudongzhengii]